LADFDPPLPRLPEDQENLRRLRREALRKLRDEEELLWRAPVYGGPPPPAEHNSPTTVYGGPPPQEPPSAGTVYGGPTMGGGGQVTRRWTLKRILFLVGAILAGLLALFFGTRKITAPVYGGPPIDPSPKDNYPVYGGPVPPPSPRPEPTPKRHQAVPSTTNQHRSSNPPELQPKSAAAVYGGPPPKPPQ
jgi:hypothetical protein